MSKVISQVTLFNFNFYDYIILALQYYSDSTLWWVLSIANANLTQGSYYIPEGTQIRIPANISRIMAQYNALNQI